MVTAVAEQTEVQTNPDCVGYVVVGRNEGERLSRCLRSLEPGSGAIVYADSGSSDGSVALARSLGVTTIVLDDSSPHTAARGRNAGFAELKRVAPAFEFVQFVDGDTSLFEGWAGRAVEYFQKNPSVAVLCGRLVEKDRDRSAFRRVTGLEWDGPIGTIASTGGIAMMRRAVFESVGGFAAALAGGEEAELCSRIREAGHVVARIDAPMGEHDSGMDRFGQWWSRTARVGRWYAKSAAAGTLARDPKGRRVLRSAGFWGGLVPALILGSGVAAIWWRPAMILTLSAAGLYAALAIRIYARTRGAGKSASDSLLYASFCILGKFAQFAGCCRAWISG